VGLGGSADTTASAQPIPAKPKVIEARRNEPPRLEASAPKAVAAAPKAADTKQAAAQPPLKPAVSDSQAATAFAAPGERRRGRWRSADRASLIRFESRFSAFK